MGIASSSQPSLRARVLPRFPARVLAGGGILISKDGLTYTFSVDPAFFSDLPLSDLVDIPTDRLLGRDTAGTGTVELISVGGGLQFNGSGSIIVSIDPAGGLGYNLSGQVKVNNDPVGGLGVNGSGQLKIADIPTDSLLGRDTTGTGVVENITVANGLQFNGSKVLLPSVNNRTRIVSFVITNPTVAGIKYEWYVPFDCVITGITMLADVSGSFQMDLRKIAYSSFSVGVTGSSICASALPTITSTIKSQDTTLTGWTTALAVGDVIKFNAVSGTTVARISVTLVVRVDT